MKKPKLQQQVTITRSEKDPESMELVAQAIIDIDTAFKKINNGPVRQSTIVLLLSHATHVPQRDVRKVLDAASRLRSTFLK